MVNVLTVRQPFASAILLARKREEYRSWRIPLGQLAIHASSTPPRPIDLADYDLPEHLLCRGVILGTVEVIGYRAVATPWGDVANVLAHPKLFAEPIPARGQLGIWHHPIHWNLCPG